MHGTYKMKKILLLVLSLSLLSNTLIVTVVQGAVLPVLQTGAVTSPAQQALANLAAPLMAVSFILDQGNPLAPRFRAPAREKNSSRFGLSLLYRIPFCRSGINLSLKTIGAIGWMAAAAAVALPEMSVLMPAAHLNNVFHVVLLSYLVTLSRSAFPHGVLIS
jgi:hypothetical protein